LIEAMVGCVDPTPSDTVVDPAARTGGFLLAAHAQRDAVNLTPDERAHLRDEFVHGVELVDGTARLAAMNLLHGIGNPTAPV
jgi:type I restriction enzyme M protein